MSILGRIPLKPLSFDSSIEGSKDIAFQKSTEDELVLDSYTGEMFIVDIDSKGVKSFISITEKIAEYLISNGGNFSGDNLTVTVGGQKVKLKDVINDILSNQISGEEDSSGIFY